jgi:outer membrane biosynthesis protein TonB
MGTASAAARAQVKTGLVRLTSGASAKLIERRVDPKYPEESREQRVQGFVTLKIRVSKDGDVIDATLVSGPALLAPYAIDAVKL